ncbi:MAG: hypothetical protein R3E79_32430 [Caldilineaceae bacterium]
MREYRRLMRRPKVAPMIIVAIILVSLASAPVGLWLSQRSRQPVLSKAVTPERANIEATNTGASSAEAIGATAATTLTITAPTSVVGNNASATPAVEEEGVGTVLPRAETMTPSPLEEITDDTTTATMITEAGAAVDFTAAVADASLLPAPLVFVSRQIPAVGTVYLDGAKGSPGVGPYSRFQVAAPGRLLLLTPDGAVRTLIDGAKPTAASYFLIDVNAPAVSYDGTQILFAGLPQGEYEPGAMLNPGAWRIFVINADGTGLRQLTFSDQDELDLTQFGSIGKVFERYDDTDPVWLPDGRIIFVSTRWPSFGQYGGARTSNLYVVNPDGSDLHRITAERNGADRPVVDPVTGRIVYARWWRNFRVPVNTIETQLATNHEGYRQALGLLSLTDATPDDLIPGGIANVTRNAWHLGSINPDGTELQLFAGGSGVFLHGEDHNQAYGGDFTPDGVFYANYFPMKNLTEAAGFGGIRRYERGAHGYTHVIGVTAIEQYPPISQEPYSFAVLQSDYATDPVVLPDGRLLISWAADTQQDYGLAIINADGSGRLPVFDRPNTTEVRARLVAARPIPPVIPDQVTTTASQLPPTEEGPYDIDGVFTFHALNVYFNGPVDSPIITGIPIGQAGTIRFYTEPQRHQPGSLDWVDWPILLQELPIDPHGAVVAQLPANVPLFEQIRTPKPAYVVPMTGRSAEDMPGMAHVLGLNFGRPGEVARCVGCHAGHSLLPVPANPADALWSNLAPSAALAASSTHPTLSNNLEGLVDRRVQQGRITSYWRSDPAYNSNAQWVQLTFPVPITVRTVRLYNPRQDPIHGTITVNAASVRLFHDAAATQEIASAQSSTLTMTGIDILFPDVTARCTGRDDRCQWHV